MTGCRRLAGRTGGPVRVDAALDRVVGLLDLVRQEDAVLRQISDGVTLLEAIQRARHTLLDVTDAELAEARAALGSRPDATVGSVRTVGEREIQSGPSTRRSS